MLNLKKNWWKIACVLLLLYTIIGGLLFDVPRRAILYETIRNQYFHVCMWFTMITMMTVSLVYSIKYLSNFNIKNDSYASNAAGVSILFGIMGVVTGAIWAKFTWSQTPLLSLSGWWVNDVKLNGAAICMLVYIAYLVLRSAIDDEQRRGKISAVFNIFAYVQMIVFLIILPRLTDSLHPGNGGNPGFSQYDLDNKMRMVFYPAYIGWTLLAVWIMNLRVRTENLKRNFD